jgi:hypothetical protein
MSAPTTVALTACLTAPVPQIQAINQLVATGYHFDRAAVRPDGVLLVRTRADDGTVAWLLVWPDKTACRIER